MLAKMNPSGARDIVRRLPFYCESCLPLAPFSVGRASSDPTGIEYHYKEI
jgi:hypothetical protein